MKVLLTEDRMAFGNALGRKLEALGASVTRCDHLQAERMSSVQWSQIDALFLDAYDLDNQQEDPRRSRLAGLDVLANLRSARLEVTPRVICYSLTMHEPRVNVPLRDFDDLVTGYFDVAMLIDHLHSALVDPVPRGQVAPPTASDYQTLGVGPNARFWEALQWMRGDDEVWDLVCSPSRSVEKRVRKRILDHCRKPLDLPEGRETTYRSVIAIAQEVARLPFQP